MAIISCLRVLRSNEGYYVGRTMLDPTMGEVPYSRDSDYFPTEERAYEEKWELYTLYYAHEEDLQISLEHTLY